MKNKARIETVRIEHMVDDSPDTSYLGEYSNTAESKYAIERTNAGRNEYRWFNPCHENYAGCTPAEIADYCAQDFKRMESLNEGQWCYIGVVAKAVIVSASGVTQTLRSAGCWGVESDSGKHIEEIEGEELSALKDELESFGFGHRAIAHAFKNVTRKEC